MLAPNTEKLSGAHLDLLYSSGQIPQAQNTPCSNNMHILALNNIPLYIKLHRTPARLYSTVEHCGALWSTVDFTRATMGNYGSLWLCQPLPENLG
jgi:hypothetical protein